MNETVKCGEAARILGVTNQTVRRYVKLGLLDATRTDGGHRRIDRSSIYALIESRRKVSTTVTVIEPT